jgi:nucleotide-binding universal stress UspA family protein
MFGKILVGYDGSNGSQTALEKAVVFARSTRAQITGLWVRSLLHHSDFPGEFEDENGAGARCFDALREDMRLAAEANGIEISCVCRAGHPAKTIVEFATKGAFNLIVVGHRGHSAFWGRRLGDTANRIADHAVCNVLIVKEEESSNEQRGA